MREVGNLVAEEERDTRSMRILILEDDPNRNRTLRRALISHDATFTETAADAIHALASSSRFDLASLDHDLGGEQMTASGENSGYAVAGYIAEMEADARPKVVVIHSMNPAGAENMYRAFHQCEGIYMRIPFGINAYWRELGVERP